MSLLRSYQNLAEAGFVQSLLESHGISATLENESTAALVPFGAPIVRLNVPEADLERAVQILKSHPIKFAGPTDDVSTFGFWRGSAIGLILYFLGVVICSVRSGHTCFSLALMFISWFSGGTLGGTFRLGGSAAGKRG